MSLSVSARERTPVAGDGRTAEVISRGLAALASSCRVGGSFKTDGADPATRNISVLSSLTDATLRNLDSGVGGTRYFEAVPVCFRRAKLTCADTRDETFSARKELHRE